MSEPKYRCIIKPPKPIILKAERYEIKVKTMVVENFSTDKRGRKIKGSEIRMVVPTELVSVRKVK